MGNSLKYILSSLTYDNLKVATFFISISSFFMLNLFSLATVSPYQALPIDDTIGMNNNILFTYFLDFSGVLSSIFVVAILVIFILFQVVMISSYMNEQSKIWLAAIFVGCLCFYGWVSYINPTIVKFESKYLTSYVVGNKVYSNNYEEAYGIVNNQKISALEKAYLNAQISADQFIQYPTENSKTLFKADVAQLENILQQNNGDVGVMDKNILYKIYKLSSDKSELQALDGVVKEVDRKAYLYGGLVIFLYAIAFYNIYLYRSKMGM